MNEPTPPSLTLLAAFDLLRNKKPAELTADEVAGVRARLQAGPTLFATVGGVEAVERFLAEAEAALAAQPASAPLAEAESSGKPPTSAPRDPRSLRRKAELAIYAILVLGAVGLLYGLLRPSESPPIPAKSAKKTEQPSPATTAQVQSTSSSPDKTPSAAKGSETKVANTPKAKDPEADPKVAKPVETELWLGWQIHRSPGSTAQHKEAWDLTNPSNPVPSKGLFASRGAMRLTREAKVGADDRWLMVHVRPDNVVAKAGQIIVTIDGQQAAKASIGIGDSEWPMYVPLTDSHGEKRKLEVAFVPGEPAQEITWWNLQFEAKQSKKSDPESKLTAAMRSTDPAARLQAITAAGQQWDPFDSFALVRALDDTNVEIRRAATQAMGKYNSGGPSFINEALVKKLADSDPAVRRLAAQSLMSFDTELTWTTLSRAMIEHSDAALRLQIVQQLAGRGDPAIVAAHDKLLKDSDDTLRLAAVAGLTNMANPDAIALLARTLADPEPGVRHSAATALSTNKQPAAEAAMLEALTTHPDLIVRRTALLRFLTLPNPKILPALRLVMQSPDDALRRTASGVLAKLPGEEIDTLLLEMYNSKDPSAQYNAAAIFWNRPGKTADDVMLSVLASRPDLELRQLAWRRFTTPAFATPRVLPALREAVKDPSATVRFDAAGGLLGVRMAKVQQAIEQGQTRAAALDELTKPPWAETFSLMLQMIDDPIPRVQAVAAGVLRGDPHPDADAVMMRLMQSPNLLVRQLASGRFPRYAQTSAKMMEFHKLCLKDRDDPVRAIAVVSLWQIATPEAKGLVEAAGDDPAFQVRHASYQLRGLDPNKVNDEALLPAEAKVAGAAAVPVLVKLLSDPKASVRGAAALRLSQNTDPAAEQAMLQAVVSHPDVFVRRAVAPSCLQRNPPSPAAMAIARDLVRSPDPELRAIALYALSRLPAADAVALIAPLMSDPVPTVRMTAASLLCVVPGPPGDDAAISLLGHADWQIREHAIARFTRTPSPRAIDGLGKVVAMPEQVSRVAALRALALVHDSAVTPVVAQAIEDPDDLVRRVALETIIGRPEPAAADLMLKALTSSPRPDVRLHAVLRFAQIPTPSALELLGVAAKDEEDALRVRAIQALARIEGARASALIAEALADPIPEVRLAAATVLGARKDEAAEAAMIAALQSNPDVEVRRLAATRFQTIPTPKAVPALAVALKDVDDQLRLLAVQVLQHTPVEGIDSLIAALGDSSEPVRQTALALLAGQPDPRAKAAVAAFKAKLQAVQ
ncbi:MAG: HEAT repeat domain-containing protein [Planctomycetes bacterium]|nr:HEAT repeat domain-containing protein [Planctomycetota bacterium]